VISWRTVVWSGLLGQILVTPCAALSPEELLGRCLADFGGLDWALPYRPSLYVHSCSSSTETYNTGIRMPTGRRSLELIGTLSLGADSTLSSDESYAAIQQAVFVHFDALFVRQGYRRVGIEHGDARTRYHENTQRLLRGLPTVPERDTEERVLPPPLPYVSVARYVGRISGGEVALTYQTEAKNTWRISLDGLPGAEVRQ
jgi:hypothetical protein